MSIKSGEAQGDGPHGGAWALVKLKDGQVVEYGEDENFAYSGNPAAATAAGMTAIGAGLALGGAAAGAGAGASRPSTNVNVYGQ